MTTTTNIGGLESGWLFMSQNTFQNLAYRFGASIISENHIKINSSETTYIYELPLVFYSVLLKAVQGYQKLHGKTILENFKDYKPAKEEPNEMKNQEAEQLAMELYGEIKADFLTPYHVKWKTKDRLYKMEIPFCIKKSLDIILFYINTKELNNREYSVLFEWFRINWQLCDI